MSLFTGAKRQFSTYVDSGTVLNSESYCDRRTAIESDASMTNSTDYSNIFSLITRSECGS